MISTGTMVYLTNFEFYAILSIGILLGSIITMGIYDIINKIKARNEFEDQLDDKAYRAWRKYRRAF